MIIKKIKKEKMNIKDFLKNKKKLPYEKYRNDAKGINFRFIYNGSAWGFAPTIKDNWTLEEMDEYIQKYNLKVMEDEETGVPNLPLTIATDIRDKFFKTYKLGPFMETLIETGKELGYADSLQGGRRHLPEAFYIGKNTSRKKVASLESILTNTSILGYEAIYMFQKMILLDKAMEEANLKSKMIYMIHDSIGGFVHKDEMEQLAKMVKDIVEDRTSYPIPLTSEMKYGDIFGYGEEIKDQDNIDNLRKKYFS